MNGMTACGAALFPARLPQQAQEAEKRAGGKPPEAPKAPARQAKITPRWAASDIKL